jgi:hypothetical protein
MSRYESAAIWSLYAKVGSGIAIRSTVKRLRKAIPADVLFGMIMYVDYKTADFRRSDDIHSLRLASAESRRGIPARLMASAS